MMKSYGLIGNPIIHSLSPLLFQKQFGDAYTYNLFPLENVEDIRLWIHQHPDLMGINITKPFKESVLPYLDELSPEAKHIGAVNVIEIQRRSENMVLKGHNTDFYGFQKSLQAFVKGLISSALILGTGGAAKAVAFALSHIGIPYKFVSRTEKENAISYEELTPEMVHHSPLIINATPLGMSTQSEESPPIPYHAIDKHHYLFDLIYTPFETRFLYEGKIRGAHIQNGYEMLQYQAEESWKIWGLL